MARRQSRNTNKQGFTLIEMLFSLVMTLLIILNSQAILKVISSHNFSLIDNSQLESGIKILSQELIEGHDFQYGSSLKFINSEEKECEVILDKDRIVLTPGYNILCHDIDKIDFLKKENSIFINITKENNNYIFVIGSDFDENNE